MIGSAAKNGRSLKTAGKLLGAMPSSALAESYDTLRLLIEALPPIPTKRTNDGRAVTQSSRQPDDADGQEGSAPDKRGSGSAGCRR